MENIYLSSFIARMGSYRSMAEKAMAQMEDEKLFWQYNSESNSVAVIVKHLAGNMLSRWTDIFNTDGEKEWRNRDAEFENEPVSRAELMAVWDEGWDRFLGTLNSLNKSDLERIIYIRNEPHTVIDAMNRQLAHYAYHVGQIVYIGKMVADENWKSLSIPRKK